MAVTKFGVIVSSGSAQIRRYVYPTASDAELNNPALVGAGEQLIQVRNGPFASSAAWQAAVAAAIQAALGKPPGNPACCVVDQTNIVIGAIMADPAIDSIPGATLVQAYAPIPIGSTYDPTTGLFTAPGFTTAGGISKTDGSVVAPVVVPLTVIPKP